jgi:hypothetical protein
MFINFINLASEIHDIFKPYSESHRIVNLIYLVFTLTSLVLYGLSYCKNYNFIVQAYSVVAIMNLVRLADFEQTRYHMSLTSLVFLYMC